MPAPRVLFFDIGNVLVRFDLPGLLKDFAWAAGSSPWGVARLMWSRRLTDDVERGNLTGEGLHEVVREQTGFLGDLDEFRRLWCGRFKLETRSAALFRKLVRRRPVYLLSNTNQLHWEFIRRRYAFAREASGSVLSFEVGARKPERAIYAAAAKAAGAAPEECLFIDDLAENVAGAKAAGMRALRFKTPARLEKDLADLGVRC
ncbi:MAG: HAD-IA family hydrolase [Elusimicrobia bacterium]|nr:HAD-IA family hydrolase [Elusimicrobiota bacterium]